MNPRLLQVCNVGQICGGTAACAWTVTRALPGFEHEVVFLGPVAEETRRVFAPHRCHSWSRVTPDAVQALRPDVVLLHNTSAGRVSGRICVPSVMYVHSRTRPAAADVTVYCSRWLTEMYGVSAERVLWQGVPLANATIPREVTQSDKASLVVGRLCTPQARKWPMEQVGFYTALAKQFPRVWWEFVGCPASLQNPFRDACRGRATFWSAGWERRGLLTTWDVLLYHQPNLPESFGRTVAEAMRVGCVPVVDRQGDLSSNWIKAEDCCVEHPTNSRRPYISSKIQSNVRRCRLGHARLRMSAGRWRPLRGGCCAGLMGAALWK